MDNISESNVALRLPGDGFSVWANPISNITACHLPGDGFSVWTNTELQSAPVRLYSQLLQLPSDGFSVWTHQAYAKASQPVTLVGAAATAVPSEGIHALGQGFSTWTQTLPAPIITKALGEAVTAAPKLTLPGEGFSIWSDAATPVSSKAAVSLPGGQFSIWQKPHREAAAQAMPAATTACTTSFPLTTNNEQPSLVFSIMKSLGLIKLIGLVLLMALLLGFLSTQQRASSLQGELSAVNANLEAKAQESRRYFDQVTDLQSLVDETKKETSALAGKLEALEKAKTGLENSLKTQISNLEAANQQVAEAKTSIEAKLTDATKALDDFKKQAKAREESLGSELKSSQEALASAKNKEAELSAELNALNQSKKDLETKLEEGMKQLQQAQAQLSDLTKQVDDGKAEQDALRKKIEDLTKALESKAAELNEAEQEADRSTEQAQSLRERNQRLAQALESSRRNLATFQASVNLKQKTLQDDHLAAGAAVDDQELRRQLENERQGKQQAFNEFVRDLRIKVEQLQNELDRARDSVES